MAVTTVRGHVSRALDFFARTDLYFAYGRTTAWPNDGQGRTEGDPDFVVPVEDVTDTALDELVAYKKVEIKHLVVPDAAGTISYRAKKWRIVAEGDAATEGARWVYMQTVLAYDEVPLQDYRQIGLYSRLVKDGAVPGGQTALLPAEVTDPGILEVTDNRKPITRQLDQKEILELVIEF